MGNNEFINSTPAVKDFDLDRYLGEWYELVRCDSWFEKPHYHDVKANYGKRDDGTVSVVNTAINGRTGKQKRAIGKARVVGNGRLLVSFSPLVESPYVICAITKDYKMALVGSSRSAFWILARDPHMDPTVMLKVVKQIGFTGVPRIVKHKL
jgi:apolipoprotein D and lipocalin family protein